MRRAGRISRALERRAEGPWGPARRPTRVSPASRCARFSFAGTRDRSGFSRQGSAGGRIILRVRAVAYVCTYRTRTTAHVYVYGRAPTGRRHSPSPSVRPPRHRARTGGRCRALVPPLARRRVPRESVPRRAWERAGGNSQQGGSDVRGALACLRERTSLGVFAGSLHAGSVTGAAGCIIANLNRGDFRSRAHAQRAVREREGGRGAGGGCFEACVRGWSLDKHRAENSKGEGGVGWTWTLVVQAGGAPPRRADRGSPGPARPQTALLCGVTRRGTCTVRATSLPRAEK